MNMKYEIDYDRKEKIGEIVDLWQEAFHDPEAFADYYFHWVYPKNQVITARDEKKKVRSMIHLNPYSWTWGRGETTLNLHYIVGVATQKEFRRQGLMAACLTKAMRDMEQNGEPFTYLMPARKEYYEPFQFVTLKEKNVWIWRDGTWQLAEGCRDSLQSDTGSPVWQYHNYPTRNETYKERLKAEVMCEDGDIIEFENGGYCAYVLDHREQGPVVVIEQFFLDESRLAGESEQPDLFAVMNEQICPELYRRYGNVQLEYVESQVMMIRILNIRNFMKLLSYPKLTKQFVIRLSDAICEKNNGIFQLTLSPSGCYLERRSGVQEGVQPDYDWNMSQLTEYLLHESGIARDIYLMEIV